MRWHLRVRDLIRAFLTVELLQAFRSRLKHKHSFGQRLRPYLQSAHKNRTESAVSC